MDMTNITQMAQDAAPLLIPLLPYLVKGVKLAGQEFVKGLGAKTGEKIPDVIEKIWTKIVPKIEETPGADRTIKQVIENPTDGRVIGSFELLLEDVLKDSSLRKEIFELLKQAKDQGVTIDSVVRIGELYGSAVGVDIEDISDFKDTKVTSKLYIKSAKEGSMTVGIRKKGKSS